MSASRRPSQPDDSDVHHVLVDGDNLLHAVRGSRDEGGLRWLLPVLRTWLPAGLDVTVVMDGHPALGEGMRRRVAAGIDIQHAGSRTADAALLAMLEARPWSERSVTVVVSDDLGLRDRVRRLGGRPRRVDWLMRRLAGMDQPTRGATGVAGARHPGSSPAASGRGPSIGQGRPALGTGQAPRRPAAESDRPSWRPGRGATRKRGNPRRGHPAS